MNRNTEWFYFQGKASWAKLVTPDVEFRNWNVKLHLTPESYDQFMKLKEDDGDIGGILNEVKQDDDGYFVVLKRPTEKKFGNETKMFTPPVVLDRDGNVLQNVLIGNGSDITCKVECYKYNKPFKKGRGRAIRLVSVRVDNLVPYERKKDFTAIEERQVQDLEKQPAQQPF